MRDEDGAAPAVSETALETSSAFPVTAGCVPESGADRRGSIRALVCVGVLVVMHAGWLAWSATWQSPTLNEPGHLASGIAHWTLGRFEPYAVNPPLVRMVAALPVLAIGCETDWSGFRGRPAERPEFALGSSFIKVNGRRSQQLFVLARWACIPFSLLGAWMCFVWGRSLFGSWSGVLACLLWCIEPNVIAHGQLITSDVAATSLGLVAMWTFWRWLIRPGFGMATSAGAALGLALLAKFSWLVLIGLWPLIWIGIRLRSPTSSKQPGFWMRLLPEVGQLAILLLTALYVVNMAYGFDGVFHRLDSFEFASSRLSGKTQQGELGNKFEGSPLGAFRVPLPRQFVLGLDLQSKDLEKFPHESYLRGEWRQVGWWWYYLYAAGVKVPLGLWLMALTAAAVWSGRVYRHAGPQQTWRHAFGAGELVLLIPALALFVLVSSQTAFNHHFRYVLPCFGPVFVLTSGVLRGAGRWLRVWIGMNVLWIFVASAAAAPFSLSYFNELAGGMRNGSAHLLHSNVDWGQDLVALEQWIADHPDARPMFVAYYGFYDPLAYGVPAETAPQGPFWETRPADWSFRPGWYAVSVNYLRGTAWRLQNRHAYEPLLSETPKAWCGGSIAVFEVNEALAKRLTEAVIRSRQ